MIDPTNDLPIPGYFMTGRQAPVAFIEGKGAFLRLLQQKELDSQNGAVLAFRVVIGWINPRGCVLGAAASEDRWGWGK
jgi:hypothetical protein